MISKTIRAVFICGIVGIALSLFHSDEANARYRGTGPVCVSGVAANDRLSIRTHPSARSHKLGSFAPGQCGMNIESVEGNWTYVRGRAQGRNIEGWVNNRYLRARSQGNNPGANPRGFPIRAASGGGKVRSGPGMNYRQVGSLREFEPITVIGRSGAMMGGYPWFKIRYRGGRRGHHWGGLICSTSRPFAGTFATCADFRRSLSGNRQPAAAPTQRRVNFSCNEGIPLIVTFIDTNNESYALYSHDSGPKNRVTSRPSGSGFYYTNGFHELRGKGRSIQLIEGGNLIDSCTAE